MPLHQEINQPLRAITSRTLLNRLHHKRLTLNIRLQRTSNSNSRTIRRKPDTDHPTTIRIQLISRTQIPRRCFNRLLTNLLFIPNTKPLTHERSEEHTSELQSRSHLVCHLLLEENKQQIRL